MEWERPVPGGAVGGGSADAAGESRNALPANLPGATPGPTGPADPPAATAPVRPPVATAPVRPPRAEPVTPPPPEPVLEGWPEEAITHLRSYVYLLVDPRTGRPFFVGRGKGDKCFRKLDALRRDDSDTPAELRRRVRVIEAGDQAVRIDILRHGLSGSEARLVEQVAADALGLNDGPTDPEGRASADALRAALARPAKFKRDHPVVLLRVAASEVDGAPDRPWRIGRRWADVHDTRAPQWAVVVADDLVRAVYRIVRWKPVEGEEGGASAGGPRFTLVGARDPEIEPRYLGRSVAAYRSAGSASNPVTYVWCGPHWVNSPS